VDPFAVLGAGLNHRFRPAMTAHDEQAVVPNVFVALSNFSAVLIKENQNEND
jgi:hypothetical protein